MAFKLVLLAATLAVARAGYLGAGVAYSAAPAVSSAYISHAAPVAYAAHAAPVAYAAHAAPVAYAAHAAPLGYAAHGYGYGSPYAVGATQQSVLRSYGGNQAVSTYSKAVDSAFSSVRKYDTRITNDGFAVAPVAAYAAHAAPIATYAAHAAPVAYAAHAAPVAYAAHAAPVAYSAAPAIAHTTFTGLGAHYAW